jgi:hypothetical protein
MSPPVAGARDAWPFKTDQHEKMARPVETSIPLRIAFHRPRTKSD